MAVELRCPDCRAKLRLPSAPEPGDDVECPDCGAVFAAPDEAPGRAKKKPATAKAPAGADDDDDAADDEPKAKPADKKPADKKPAGDKTQAKRRKGKKKETNKTALILIIGGVVLFLAVLISLLVWFFGRKPVGFEMMTYLPDDCTTASGLNIGHMSKYSEFIKVVERTYQDEGFKRASDLLAGAAGTDTNTLIDYMIIGSGKSGPGLVLRVKKGYNAAELVGKLPGARSGTADGLTYYMIAGIDKLWAGTTQELRAFAPTEQLVVFCPVPSAANEPVFRRMLKGNRDDTEKTLGSRVGALGKRTMRGTFWYLQVFDAATRPAAPDEKNAGDPTRGAFQKEAATTTASAQGMGFKASLGSRAIRFEVVIWCRDSDKASELYKQYKESPLAKGDEEEPPRFWKDFAQNVITNKKAAIEMYANLGAKSSGELFVLYSECDTRLIMEIVSSLASKIIGKPQGGPGVMPGAGGGGMPGAAPGGAPPGRPPGMMPPKQ